MCKKSVWLVLMALGFTAAPAATHAQVVNLAHNPSFEEDEVILDDPTWTMWATWGYDSGLNSTVALDDTEFIDGARSLRIIPTGDTNWYFIVLNLPIPLQVGTRYTASFWVKAEAPRPLGVQFKDTANKPVTWGYTDFQLTTDWAEYSMTSAAQDAEMKLEFFCSGSEVPFWLDFLYVYEGEHVDGIEPSAVASFGKALRPAPADDTVDVPRDAVLSWTPAEDAQSRDVYFGTDFAAVSDADTASPRGVLASGGQSATTYAPADLQYGQTYYWRVDEVGAPPDSTVLKGDVWQFTVEPYAYRIENVTATASSAQSGMEAQNTVNGSGLNANDEHSVTLTQMWMSAGVPPNWIQYEFDAPYKLHELWVWNSNQLIEPFVGFGARNVAIEYSRDGATWTVLEGVPEFVQATGSPTYTANTVVDFGGATARYVKLTITKTWGGVAPQTSLSEVRFFHIPVQARVPQPAVGATDVSVDTELSWRPGREATSHEVYVGTDESVMALADTVTEHSYTLASLDFGTTYFWQVDEVGDAGTYAGNVWSFTTREYATIEDFETYNDDDNRIYDTWIDGLTDQAKGGSQVGYDESPFAERTIVHAGKQSMPLLYNNAAGPFLSEAERTFESPQDWTAHGADSLLLHFQGAMPAFVETPSGSILMNAIGTDIWDAADQFRFAYKTLNGNGTMVARVESIVRSDVWAKGGVMIRQSIEPGSAHAFMPITPGGGNGASFQRRPTVNQASANDDSATAVTAPYWVKIERASNSFSGSISPDGVTWTPLGTAQTITMTGPVLIGLALCSHSAAAATGAEFSNVSTTGNVTGAWQVAEIGAAQPEGNSIESLYVTIEDSAGKSETVMNPDTMATVRAGWQPWKIPLSEFTTAGVKMSAVKSMTLGVGNKAAPAQGGSGTLYIDDIGYGRPLP